MSKLQDVKKVSQMPNTEQWINGNIPKEYSHDKDKAKQSVLCVNNKVTEPISNSSHEKQYIFLPL